MQLLISDSYGIYIPNLFCANFKDIILNKDNEILECIDICLKGPDHLEYWDAWEYLLDNVILEGDSCLHEDEGLWSI